MHNCSVEIEPTYRVPHSEHASGCTTEEALFDPYSFSKTFIPTLEAAQSPI